MGSNDKTQEETCPTLYHNKKASDLTDKELLTEIKEWQTSARVLELANRYEQALSYIDDILSNPK